jgi:hypothetical protein
MIHRIRIQNFKSLRDVTVDLSPVTVLIGKSGTGKTNFASAIRFLRDILVSGAQGPLRGQEAALKCATNPTGAIGFQVEFDVPDFGDRFTYSLVFNEGGIAHPPREESLECGPRTVFRQTFDPDNRPRWDTEPSLVTPPDPGPIAIGRLPGLEEVVVAYTALTAGIGVYAFPYDVLTPPSKADGASGLADDAGNFLTVLKEIGSSLQNMATRKGIAAALRKINPTVASVELDSIQNPQGAFVGHRLGEKTLPLELRQESDGFRRFYAHLLALYQTPPKQTLVFEEPENGIYPGALELLADEFKTTPEAGRGQVLLTTHSPALLDHFSAEHIRVVELDERLETRIGPLAEEQKEALREELLHAGELLTVDPARSQSE